jgi:hypothetical protein
MTSVAARFAANPAKGAAETAKTVVVESPLGSIYPVSQSKIQNPKSKIESSVAGLGRP